MTTIAVTRIPRSGSSTASCPVCEAPTDHAGKALGWGEWRRCRICTLEFVHPLRLRLDPKALFNDAYRGKVSQNRMRDFSERANQRTLVLRELKDPSLWFWTPAFAEVLEWLERRVRRGSTVLDLGCGLGWFLHAMRGAGFHAVGLDAAEVAVTENRADGFRVWHGTVETMPADWVKADAVVSFFMLHHLDDPIGFLKAVRAKAPGAPVAIAEYGPTNRGGDASQPPRTLTRWNAKSLGIAMESAGYRARAVDVPSTGAEHRAIRPARRLLRRTMAWPNAYQVGKRIEAALTVRLLKSARQNAYVVLAYGEPLDGEGRGRVRASLA